MSHFKRRSKAMLVSPRGPTAKSREAKESFKSKGYRAAQLLGVETGVRGHAGGDRKGPKRWPLAALGSVGESLAGLKSQ